MQLIIIHILFNNEMIQIGNFYLCPIDFCTKQEKSYTIKIINMRLLLIMLMRHVSYYTETSLSSAPAIINVCLFD